MAILTRQFRQFPTSGNIMTSDANPLSSRLGYDMVQGINNLHYTQPWIAYAAAPTASGVHGAIFAEGALAGSELFAAQFPTVVPDGMKRFCWTLGFYVSYYEDTSPYTIDLTVNPVNVYISPKIYAAPTAGLQAPSFDTTSAFDVTALGGNYGLSAYTTPIVFTALPSTATSVHGFIDMSAGTTGAIVPFDTKVLDGALNAVNIIVTFTSDAAAWAPAGGLTISLASFTSWFLME